MANQITAINSYSNSTGSRKALAFDSQDELLEYVKEQLDLGNITSEKKILWKAYVPNILGSDQIREFYTLVNGSVSKTLIKDYFREVKHVRDPVPEGYISPDPYVETFENLWLWLGAKDWLLVWQS